MDCGSLNCGLGNDAHTMINQNEETGMKQRWNEVVTGRITIGEEGMAAQGEILRLSTCHDEEREGRS